ncbi:SRPBCC family protein [Halorarius halobius]|uniref:SRPBCC family protein n=1 Tax=Halorarius halobius TaxID=2962671 RepID=UPI0020CD2BD7|nr:SRPBCC family protein [Halorarius halobius]
MDAVEVTTVVYLPREEVYEFLTDFPGYARYSKHLDGVDQYGDGSPGTEYALHFTWWKLSYTARSEVTATDKPARIDWRLTKDLKATGYWAIESEVPPDDRDVATRVRFRVEYHPDTANEDAISLPRFVSWDWLFEKLEPKVREEAERVVRRIVRDLEGEARPVELEIETY